MAHSVSMHLLRDPDELARLMAKNCPPELLCDFDAAKWLSDASNFALVDGDDLGLAEAGAEWPGPLTIHTFYASRGRKAFEVGRAMLKQCFDYGATAVRGEIQLERRHVLRAAGLVGFKRIGEFERPELGRFATVELTSL